ncbi:MAG TPA: hypothetical protein EYQ61_06285 [Dehalococcoidia bacterium]|nr:hypothetical protein [Dehalococcoidia bacterium]HIK89189.1 hypothetical protein [Dehalococcoidia bacterium]
MNTKRGTLSSRAIITTLLAALAMLAVACGGGDDPASSVPPTEEPVQIPEGPIQVIEHIEATSVDGILFDLKLALPLFDQNGANGRRDDAEIITPDKTEYQGVFADGLGTLFIVSCLADVCQTDTKTATFEIHYWVESFPDPIPDGVDFIGE